MVNTLIRDVHERLLGRRAHLITLWCCLFVSIVSCSKTQPATDVSVLDVADDYEADGGWSMASTGSPVEIKHKSVTILKQSSQGTHCSGYTFAVVMDTAARRGLLDDKPIDKVWQFQREWFASTPESSERSVVVAMRNLGIGREVSPDNAREGDFVQFWRRGETGHTAIFVEWLQRNGKAIGIKYRSSQIPTDGIGDHVEYFTPSGVGSIIPDRFYVARLNPGQRG